MYQILRSNLVKIRYFCSSVKTPLEAIGIARIVPLERVQSKIDATKLPPKTKIDANTIALLERLSLVDCESKKAIETVESALEFADQILQVDTTNVEPLISVLEDIPLRVREDEITDGNCKEAVLKNAALTEEEYFVAPPGNIPLESREDPLFDRDHAS
ncbi:glutamyl-tRNA(Gln) amidotransferase subunit C, mitochondrial [Leptinotarsa decemlineata]|uniref:glutamyl-tRNA(Gln) amidotransferase subunit C, mitochondrial n=1 Tax=Leptinotarsa decemlineata TaxID=7539 RepID=UPI003D304C89